MPPALIVNAGGASRRMGQNKALLTTPAGSPLVVYLVRRLAVLAAAPLIVVANDPAVAQAIPNDLGAIVVADRWQERGPLGGLASGLALCPGWAVVVACDMPLVDPALVGYLVDLANANVETQDAVVPHVGGHAQVFHALYHRRCLPAMFTQVEAGRLAVQAALDYLRVRWVEESELTNRGYALTSFLNINTPEEWAAVRPLLL
jgi:molybdopterin-guanine dinucleotide biosynthesis protein A